MVKHLDFSLKKVKELVRLCSSLGETVRNSLNDGVIHW